MSYLFPITGSDRSNLLEQLTNFQQTIRASKACSPSTPYSLPPTPFFHPSSFILHPSQTGYALALIGHDKESLLQEIDLAFQGITHAFETGQDWSSALGSYFTPDPLAANGSVAFVYPGASNSYPGLGRDIFRLFPDLHDRFGRIVNDMGRAIAETWLYPRSLERLSP